ncbi:putative Zn finger-like uncharacterized protein [Desulfobaculum xiamenense]|uniref:Putative Zn finger-like uncharacterized protein n=1 Tax=Desulfobaculum xiamenense TaxID=995050 RepID=A0A846QNF9_9BACT|nr:DUF3426 domain-containing protein [Desulfobaculum xiamenense]NJB66935.1 putative Zn finger-like uncharacterized protein [Desulfobaculum xiamenense]
MVVECPNCHTTYNLDEQFATAGRKVRCTVCENIFTLSPTSAPPKAGKSEAPSEKPSARKDAAREEESFEGLGSLSFDIDEGAKPAKGGRAKTVAIVLMIFALLAGGSYAGLRFLAPQYLPAFLGGKAAMEEIAMEQAEQMEEMVKRISLESIRQYYVDNEKAGRIFVIEGRAINGFEVPKELVEVEASLFDDKNAVLDSRRLLCGNTLSLFQLQVLDQAEIEKALTDEAGVGSNNVNLQPGQEAPFMFVFFSPSDAVSEFVVKVVAVQSVDM